MGKDSVMKKKQIKMVSSPASPQSSSSSSYTQLLITYVQLWSIATCARALSKAGRELKYNNIVAVTSLFTFFFPQYPLVMLIGFGSRIYALIASLPYIHNSQHWCLQTDLAMFVAILSIITSRLLKQTTNTDANNKSKKKSQSISWITKPLFTLDDDGDNDSNNDNMTIQTAVTRAIATFRYQLILMYFAAAYYKANSGFLSHRYSCATIYLLALLDHWTSSLSLSLSVMNTLTNIVALSAPIIVFLVEAIIPGNS